MHLELVDQITTLTGLSPVGVGFIISDETTVHQSPDAASNALTMLSQSNAAAVLGQDESGDWLYVLADSLVQGWMPVDGIRLAAGDLAEAPVLPPDQINTVNNQAIADLTAVDFPSHSLNFGRWIPKSQDIVILCLTGILSTAC